jgi:hypothetical protein
MAGTEQLTIIVGPASLRRMWARSDAGEPDAQMLATMVTRALGEIEMGARPNACQLCHAPQQGRTWLGLIGLRHRYDATGELLRFRTLLMCVACVEATPGETELVQRVGNALGLDPITDPLSKLA